MKAEMMGRCVVGGAALALLLVAGSAAQAQAVFGNQGGFYKIGKGTKDLSFENLLIARSLTVPQMDAEGMEIGEISTFALSWTPGLHFRYYLADNFAVGVFGGAQIVRSSQTTALEGEEEVSSTSQDIAGMALLTTNYALRLGSGLFFRPGIGAGLLFAGTRSLPDPEDASKTIQSDLSGFVGRGDLGFVFYASESWNLRAGLDVLFTAGTNTPRVDEGEDQPEGQGFTAIDIGFNIGMGYSF